MQYEQLYLFKKTHAKQTLELKEKTANSELNVSRKINASFEITNIPFLECDFEKVYPTISTILPSEDIVFNEFSHNTAVLCEIICAAICHQMNWDYLRKAIYDKTKSNPSWLYVDHLISISEREVEELFISYPKKERIRKKERTEIIREVGKWLSRFNEIDDIFLDKSKNLYSQNKLKSNLHLCPTFSKDPEEKKTQLLLQKLSSLNYYKGLSSYYAPAIDYHLIRSYLRRGLLIAKNNYAKNFIYNYNISRKESTIAALRELCAQLMLEICNYTNLDLITVNQIEWHIGRSVCIQNNPDCMLNYKESSWLKPKYTECPFSKTCVAKNYNSNLLQLNEPSYNGNSY